MSLDSLMDTESECVCLVQFILDIIRKDFQMGMEHSTSMIYLTMPSSWGIMKVCLRMIIPQVMEKLLLQMENNLKEFRSMKSKFRDAIFTQIKVNSWAH